MPFSASSSKEGHVLLWAERDIEENHKFNAACGHPVGFKWKGTLLSFASFLLEAAPRFPGMNDSPSPLFLGGGSVWKGLPKL